MPWYNRFRRWLKDGRPCMERLFKLLEHEVEPVASWQEDALGQAARLPVHWRGSQVSKELGDAISRTGTDGVAEKARELGDTCGFELYRWIYAKHKGVGPEQGQVAFRAVTCPTRCRNTQELRDSLQRMARDIRECEAYGSDFTVTAQMRTLALEQRLPADLLRELENWGFTTFEKKMEFVQRRVELDHQRRLNGQGASAAWRGPAACTRGGARGLR